MMGGVDSLPPSSVDLPERLLMTSSSSKPVALSRRAVLGAGGVGLAAALSACARTVHPPVDIAESESASASPSASPALPSANKSYKGKVTFDNFEKNGEYVPATAEKKAQNVPKPLAPANMNEDNVDGMYAFIGYWLASFNYALMTGDTEPMKKADPADVYAKSLQEFTLMYESDLGWMYGTDTPVTMELISSAPQKPSGSGTRYYWPGYMNYSADAKIHREGKSDLPFKTASSPNGKLMKAAVEYKDGKWFMLTGNEGSQTASASSGSSSSV